MILGTGYDRSVDAWALGVLVHELFTGVTPFADAETKAVIGNILRAKVSLAGCWWWGV